MQSMYTCFYSLGVSWTISVCLQIRQMSILQDFEHQCIQTRLSPALFTHSGLKIGTDPFRFIECEHSHSNLFRQWKLISDRFNLLGQVAVTTGITFGCANLISTLATVQSNYKPTAARTIGIYAALLVSHGTINTFGVKVLRYLNNVSITLHSIGVTCFAIAVLAKAPTHQSAKFVFASFYDGTGTPGWSVRASPAYVAVCGILMSEYTITGLFDESYSNLGLAPC